MSDSEDVYEVESIITARVEKKKGKKQVLIWKYCVRWKGYSAEDDTWEPVESFEGSEDIIERFWERANTNGRDYRDLNLFTAGEEFLPMGPPRAKRNKTSASVSPKKQKQQKSPHQVDIDYVPKAATPGKRQRHSVSEIEDEKRPSKRQKRSMSEEVVITQERPATLPRSRKKSFKVVGSPTSDPDVILPMPSQSNKKRTLSPEIIPDSDDEVLAAVQPDFGDDDHLPNSGDTADIEIIKTTPTQQSAVQVVQSMQPEMRVQEPKKREHKIIDPHFVQQRIEGVPFHHARASKPLVKTIDHPNLAGLGGALSAKTRAVVDRTIQNETGPSSSKSSATTPRVRPGPGRSSGGIVTKKSKSSLLTFEKGALKTIKGNYAKPEEPRPIPAPEIPKQNLDESRIDNNENNMRKPSLPTAEQLLRVAGLDTEEAEALSDFEDEKGNKEQSTNNVQSELLFGSISEESALKVPDSLAIARDKLFPSESKQSSGGNIVWKSSTIFGPLSSGPTSEESATHTERESHSAPFFLNLDSSVSLPVYLTNSPRSGGPSLDCFAEKKGPPGQFYDPASALFLLGTLRATGPSARITIDEKATEDDRKHYERFCSRLESGDLYVGMAGVDLLAFCSSDNALISQRLNIPAALFEVPHSILVSRVTIENFSAYADAVEKADSTRWMQYITSS